MSKFELKLGGLQLTLLLSLFFLGLASSYYFGFTAGRTVGHEKALAAALAASPKTPLSPDEPITLKSDDLYARLSEAPSTPPEQDLKIIETLELEDEKTSHTGLTLGDLVSDSLSKEDLQPLSIEKATPKAPEVPIPTEKPTEPPKPTEKPNERPTEKPKKVEESSLVKGWFVQVAASQEKADADKLIEKLKTNGFKASIEVALVREQKYYRVLVGPESSKELADRLLTQVSREPYLDGTPFLKFIK